DYAQVKADGYFLESKYQVVVEEERPRRTRRAAEILRCYPVPIHFQNATVLNSQYYFTAELPMGDIKTPVPFCIGDNRTYNGYWNAPLLPHKSYSIYYQAVSTANGTERQQVLHSLTETERQQVLHSLTETERQQVLHSLTETERQQVLHSLTETERQQVLHSLTETERQQTERQQVLHSLTETERQQVLHSLTETERQQVLHSLTETERQQVLHSLTETERQQETKIDCVRVATKAAIIVTQLTTPYIRIAPAAGDNQLTGTATRKPDAVEPEKQTDHTVKIAGVIAGVLLFVIIFLGVVLVMKK
ncbi:unnamed protein product, partial [Coregonus sp. 'balchen']